MSGLNHIPYRRFPRLKACQIAKKYGFHQRYDLQNELSEAVRAYTRRSSKYSSLAKSMKQYEQDLKNAVATGIENSPYTVVVRALHQTRCPDDAKNLTPEKLVKRSASVELRKLRSSRTPGRQKEVWKSLLYSELGNIFYAGTIYYYYLDGAKENKTFHIRGTRGKYSGPAYDFLVEVLSIMKADLGITGLYPHRLAVISPLCQDSCRVI